MKAVIVVIWFTLIGCQMLPAQSRNSIFMEETPVTWLGIDFTGAIFYGDEDKFPDDEAIHKFIESLNNLMLAESAKYDIAKTFRKNKVTEAFYITASQNKRFEASALLGKSTDPPHKLSENIVQEIVASYDFQGLSGLGLLFNVESFSKTTVSGVVWVTFVNMATKEVLLTERLSNPPRGFGLRNYWAGCIYGILKQIQSNEFSSWQQKYYRNQQ
ncbi:MAG: hypothetical protein KF803_01405 [Cyclobacteriaceae bacterium]|nr:hypothetical protein [Cyclobacteriaceae bacterium]